MVTAALVVMTILGCDDSVSQCHYVDTVKGRWDSVAACDGQSQKTLPSYANARYPVIVAMCEQTQDAPIATAARSGAIAAPPVPDTAAAQADPPAALVPDAAASAPEPPPAAAPAAARPEPLPRRAYALLRGVLPDRHKIQDVLVAPVHSLGDGYAWVATRLKR